MTTATEAANFEAAIMSLIRSKPRNIARYDMCWVVAKELAPQAGEECTANLAYGIEKFWTAFVAAKLDEDKDHDAMGEMMGRNA
jgi:hypothetical protein